MQLIFPAVTYRAQRGSIAFALSSSFLERSDLLLGFERSEQFFLSKLRCNAA
jgi:hypothetical protein